MKSFFARDGWHPETMSMILRVGLGLVFVIGGWNKLYQLLNPHTADAILNNYMGSSGYINQFFADYLFSGLLGSVLTPWSFLTTLSAFELISGCMLILGLLVRPLSLFWALLLWSFIVSLPVVTTPGVISPENTYNSPALFVQIRDIALSGLFILLYNLGAGRHSIGELFGSGKTVGGNTAHKYWNEMGLLLRISMALPFLIAGFFHGLDDIQTFGLPAVAACVLGIAILFGIQMRLVGSMVVLAMLYFILQKITLDKSLIANLNSFKREFAFLAAGFLMFHAGGGTHFTPKFKVWMDNHMLTSANAS